MQGMLIFFLIIAKHWKKFKYHFRKIKFKLLDKGQNALHNSSLICVQGYLQNTIFFTFTSIQPGTQSYEPSPGHQTWGDRDRGDDNLLMRVPALNLINSKSLFLVCILRIYFFKKCILKRTGLTPFIISHYSSLLNSYLFHSHCWEYFSFLFG